jgi:hypothetical protein
VITVSVPYVISVFVVTGFIAWLVFRPRRQR